MVYFVIIMLYSMYVVLLCYCMCVYCYLYSMCIVLYFCALCIMSLQQGRTALPIARRLNYKSHIKSTVWLGVYVSSDSFEEY